MNIMDRCPGALSFGNTGGYDPKDNPDTLLRPAVRLIRRATGYGALHAAPEAAGPASRQPPGHAASAANPGSLRCQTGALSRRDAIHGFGNPREIPASNRTMAWIRLRTPA